MRRLFGTDGVRGIVGKDLTEELAQDLGWAGAYALTRHNAHQPTIIVGCDTRESKDSLSKALMQGICNAGANAIYAGVLPTPAIAYLTRAYKADAGVVISASHNPAEFNGIKFFNQDGYKLSDGIEDEIEDAIKLGFASIRDSVKTQGTIRVKEDAVLDYIEHMKNTMPINLVGLKIAVDCAEGASYISSVKTLSELGAEVIPIHNHPDGKNINVNCGSTHMEELSALVVAEGADLGLAFDGDADRLLAVDETGKIIDGDQIMSICGAYMKQKGQLKKDTIVATVMSNLGFSLMGEKNKINIVRTKVGDRYVLENMLENGYNLGGEQSGHIIFLDENTTGDGLLSALHLLEVVTITKKTLSQLAEIMEVLPQALVNARVADDKKNQYEDYPEITQEIKKLEERYAGQGRILIRPSGTEPLVRVMIEGKDQQEIYQQAVKLAAQIENIMG
ncbi:MAG: phosphoglucosamine mutase [Lachnospiraceae bacterium]